MKNILLFDEILSKRVIQDFIIAKIINQHLIMKLNNLPKVTNYDFNGQIILWFVIFDHFRIPQRWLALKKWSNYSLIIGLIGLWTQQFLPLCL